MATYVLIPGAWLGGWCWDRVAPILRAVGHHVVTPTLTGLADRASLLTRDVDLGQHVLDVIDVIVNRGLRDVVLVGHSYGGTVISAVASEIPAYLRWVVFLDASVPTTGESNNDALPRDLAQRLRESAQKDGHGWLVPPPSTEGWGLDRETRAWVEAMLTPHPLATLEQPVWLRRATTDVRRAFFLTSLTSPWYRAVRDRVRKDGWYCRELEGGHYAMFTAPYVVADALIELEQGGVVL
jgi:pimeloyl-ACP methyl ester carboxylesterase